MKVKSGKTTIEVAVKNLNHTVGELKEQLAEITHFADIKLIHAGKVLRDDMTVGAIPGGFSAVLTMMGSTPSDIQSLEVGKETASTIRIRDDLSKGPESVNRSTTGQPRAQRQHNPYKFESIQTLPHLPDEAKAREILHTLANDEGVLAVMKKHKWSVGALCELYPEGYVGVSDVCVMGLNENHGQRILLRLRTDDLKGFRKILSIRKVLCHELAHNEHSEHDANFYILMRQIEREITELDWKNSRGRTLHGGPATERYIPTGTGVTDAADSGVHILGGATDPLLQQLIPARYLAGTAAIMRLSAEEQEVEDNCASGREEMLRGADIERNKEELVEVEAFGGEQAQARPSSSAGRTEEEKAAEDGDDSRSEGSTGRRERATEAMEVDSERSIDSPVPQPTINALQEEGAANADPTTPAVNTEAPVSVDSAVGSAQVPLPVAPIPPVAAVSIATVQQAVLANIDEAVAFALSTESAAAPVEKLLALRDAMATLLDSFHAAETQKTRSGSATSIGAGGKEGAGGSAPVAALLACLNVLHQIVRNAKVGAQAMCS